MATNNVLLDGLSEEQILKVLLFDPQKFDTSQSKYQYVTPQFDFSPFCKYF